jgi:hypothetical protein
MVVKNEELPDTMVLRGRSTGTDKNFLVKEVRNGADEKLFLHVHVACNQRDPNWVRPLDKDILDVFDRAKNRFFRSGDAIRWIVFNSNYEPVGRIAAFVNKKYRNKGDKFPVGGLGFFDCINDQATANVLFDTAKRWLVKKGVAAMDGPINFGERDRWWGLLVDGFYPPLYGMNYNPPYYQQLFESYGFRNFYNQLCWTLPVAGAEEQLDHKFYDAHDRYSADPEFKATYIRSKDLQKCIGYFCTVYNKAWAKHEGNKEITFEQAARLFRSLEPVLDPYLVWFAFYRNEPIAMWISIPDINQILKHLDGRFDLWGKLKFLYYKTTGACNRFVGLIYGIVPEFQGTGVDYFMIVEAEKVIKSKTRYKSTELLWQGDFNPKMLNISKHLGGQNTRTLITYRYIFDPQVPFERHPVIG